MALLEKIRRRDCLVGVIGLGYVGLPLATEFARAGFRVTGFDVDPRKIAALNAGQSYIPDVPTAHVADVVRSGHLRATDDMSALREMDCIDIAVPTPLRKTKDPDMSYVVRAVAAVRQHLRAGQLICLESTTYPGTTNELVRPMLEETGLRAGRDFHLVFSPERVDPGNANYQTRDIPKIVGGHDARSTEIGCALYDAVVTSTVPVSSTVVAEMAKLLENTFRAVNIGMANELARMCYQMKIDVWEVIDAARTKPFGFMPFYPGPGLGGHCIPIDPYYLSWKARQSGFEARFIELAGHVNGSMPEWVVWRLVEALNTRGRAVNGSRVHVYGVAYKKNSDDVRESPAIDLIEHLLARGATVSYSDPYVPSLTCGGTAFSAIPPEAALAASPDCVVIATDHEAFDYEALVRSASLIMDTRNALRGRQGAHIFRL